MITNKVTSKYNSFNSAWRVSYSNINYRWLQQKQRKSHPIQTNVFLKYSKTKKVCTCIS